MMLGPQGLALGGSFVAGWGVGSAANYFMPDETRDIIGDTVLGSLQSVGLYGGLPQ